MAAVKVLEKNGIRRTVDIARRLGVESPLGENLSVALGTSDLTLLEITSAYGALANQGDWMRPTAIRYVLDSQRQAARGEHARRASRWSRPSSPTCMTHMLRGTIERGTGAAARALGRPAAAKTGTTNDYSNAWFIGYTPQLVTGVWVGYDRPRSLGKDETGSRVAVPIWTAFMQEALAGTRRGGLPDSRAGGAGPDRPRHRRGLRAAGDDGLHRGDGAQGDVRARALRARGLPAREPPRADRRVGAGLPLPAPPAPAPPAPRARRPADVHSTLPRAAIAGRTPLRVLAGGDSGRDVGPALAREQSPNTVGKLRGGDPDLLHRVAVADRHLVVARSPLSVSPTVCTSTVTQ